MRQRINNQLPNNLPQLQNCIKRDPSGYKDEFIQQYEHFKSLLDVFQFNPAINDKDFKDLVLFLAHVCSCYPDELSTFPNELVKLLKSHATNLNQDVRMTLVRALILLRNKSLLTANSLMSLFFELLRCQDKALRSYLKEHIINDIKNVNSKHKNLKLNTSLQNFMFSMLKDSNAIAAKISLDIMIELYHKNVWKDAKTVNVISTACFSKIAKIVATALKFFLGKDENESNSDDESDTDNDSHMPSAPDVALSNRVNKKTRKRKKILERTNKIIKKFKKKTHATESFNFSAIHLLNDPQTLAENLFKMLESFNERFEVKLMLINFISRLIGIHELFLLNFYPYLQRYLHPKQREVTKLLQYMAQASHELVPPDVIEPLVKLIANNFVTERNSNEVMAVGINSIREICSRCPLAMNEDLLQDLAEYSSFRDKNVSMASKSLIQLYRVVNPGLLKKKDRGRPTQASDEQKIYKYAESKALNYISGTEVLTENQLEEDENDGENDDGSDDDSDGDWIDVPQSEDENELLDGDDDDNDDGDYDEEEDEEDEEEQDDDKKKETNKQPEDTVEKAKFISSERILSQEEFQKVKLAQLSKQVRAAKPRRFKKSSSNNEPDVLPNLNTKEIVSLSSIERLYKRSKSDKIARLESIMNGREERGKFGARKGKLNEFASKNKKELTKTKNFMMIKHKLNRKKKKSFREKQTSLKNALLKRCKQG
ncbi:hypothetical protein RDWZM_008092 [Blomia tropicalis]|uniref:Protein SDA1 n=1 Tax=Blomia tropicalis TaxID=40697 RepID=A0A9Q0M3V4_BLOTA|nr:Protein SDA1 [Blomia tropicalis]KAJ6216935.1 hypothetical protein RDWZM_008092 [Blomia tropicalis]